MRESQAGKKVTQKAKTKSKGKKEEKKLTINTNQSKHSYSSGPSAHQTNPGNHIRKLIHKLETKINECISLEYETLWASALD